MLALGLSMLVSVAAAQPATTHERLASTYDEAFCDPADGGECAEEANLDIEPPTPAILDCESPFIAAMIGSCDLPAPALPSLHVPTLHNGGPGHGFSSAAPSSSDDRLSVVASASSLDGAMPVVNVSLHPAPLAGQLAVLHATRAQEAPRSRLDRPPRV
ncbi:MAG TPA: hypothetical protein VN947_02240 [Polyangia bacterium]|nr:hypothetical protein [Polyangia bacterium]